MSMASEYNTRVSDCIRHAGNNVALSGIVLPVGTPPFIHPGRVFGNRGTRLTCRLSRLLILTHPARVVAEIARHDSLLRTQLKL
jgi:hypothetical protein